MERRKVTTSDHSGSSTWAPMRSNPSRGWEGQSQHEDKYFVKQVLTAGFPLLGPPPSPVFFGIDFSI